MSIRSLSRIVATSAISVIAGMSVFAGPQSTHPPAFWKAIVDQKFAVPSGSTASALANELSEMLGSPDPELRDEIAYTILTNWIFVQKLLQPSDVRSLMAQWTDNLKRNVGGTGTTDVCRRSFSALMLSVVVARDNADPFLQESEVHGLLSAALTYLSAEKDIRGYDPAIGWMHSAAHTADLLKFLGRSRFVTVGDQRKILDAIGAKLSTAGDVFTHGEDERMARAALSIVHRADFDQPSFSDWIAKTKPVAVSGAPVPAKLHDDQNIKNLFAKLEVLLSLEADPNAAVRAATDSVRTALKTMF